PGWYARRRFTREHTMAYPLAAGALVEDPDGTHREVVGVDAAGQWPGGDDNEPGADFVRYLHLPPEAGQPDDVVNPVSSPAETR
ncbi:MAG: hypothetical protein AUI14_12560, partial [Actinobacteria bacterium 13_2_20CM_2_71_6]